MHIQLKPDKRIFVIFLLINAAGYNYENNPLGFHPIRKYFRQKIRNLSKKDTIIHEGIKIIKSFPLRSEEYIRLVNLVVLPDEYLSLFDNIDKSKAIYKKWKKILPIFNNIVNKKEIDIFFKDYSKKIKGLPEYKINRFKKEFLSVIKFFNLRILPLKIKTHLNLLDSYNRGTNYFTKNSQYICLSLNIKNKINWATLKHEFMHILLKYLFKNELRNLKISIPVNKNYAKDNLRTKFDENFILAANTFFLKDKNKQENNLKYYYDHGFRKINTFKFFIEENFVKNKKRLSSARLNELVKQLK